MDRPARATRAASVAAGVEAPLKLVDCDVHNTVPGLDALFPYLAEHWVEYGSESAFKGPVDTAYPRNAPTTVAPMWRNGEASPGTSLDLVRSQLLDPLDIGCGILNCSYAVDSIHNPDTACQIATAVNEWQVAEWLDPEPRLRASVVVPSQLPALAAREIERAGRDRRFVQVLLPARSAAPYGNRNYHPIFEAAQRMGLAVALHFGGAPGGPPTSSGWTSHYLEDYVGMSQVFQTQVLSLIGEGVFDRFPEVRVVCVEGGFTWLPALLWRIDKVWKGLRRDVPWVRRLPSEYVAEHIRFTTQPLDLPESVEETGQVLGAMEAERLLMFSTDYPHWHFDGLDEAVPAALPAALRPAVLAGNATAFYRLDGAMTEDDREEAQ